jgi:ABC-type polysaccharide/polyol phosphate export permease
MTYIFEGMRKVLRGDSMPLRDLLMSFGLNMLYLAIAILFFGSMFQRSRSRGLGRLE